MTADEILRSAAAHVGARASVALDHDPRARVREIPDDCVFCAIVWGDAPATIVQEWDDAIAIVPLGPVVDGHVLVIPRVHVADFASEPEVTAATMRRAAEYAAQHNSANLITSMGAAATQTVYHLHLHVVPRREGDGLALPWTDLRSQPELLGYLPSITRVGRALEPSTHSSLSKTPIPEGVAVWMNGAPPSAGPIIGHAAAINGGGGWFIDTVKLDGGRSEADARCHGWMSDVGYRAVVVELRAVA